MATNPRSYHVPRLLIALTGTLHRIAWRSIGGTDNGGVVTFHHLNNTTSRIMVQIGYEPEGLVEKAGDLLGVASHRVQGDLERFKEYLERSGTESAIDTAISKTRPAKAIN
jgi:uncharacterized membrane protein